MILLYSYNILRYIETSFLKIVFPTDNKLLSHFNSILALMIDLLMCLCFYVFYF